MPDGEVSRLRELEKELFKTEIETDVSEIKVGKRKLTRLQLGDNVYTYDREKRLLRNVKTRQVTPLTGEDREIVDFIIDSVRRLKRDVRDATLIRQSISRRLQKLPAREQSQLAKARRSLGKVGI
jgi:hypothetical protein